MRVMVYCNIRTNLLSIKALEGKDKGRVVAHAEELMVRDAEFKVSEASRQRAVQRKRKSVHAGVYGEVVALWGATLSEDIANSTILGLAVGKPFQPFDGGVPVKYNPDKTKTFEHAINGAPIKRADLVHLKRCVVTAVGVA